MSVFISPDLLLGEATEFPLTHARIGYRTLLRVDNISVSSAHPDHPGVNAVSVNTYQFWRPQSLPATLTVEVNEEEEVDYLGIARHTLAGCRVRLQSSVNGSDWVTHGEAHPDDNRALMLLIEPASARYWRVLIDRDGVGDMPEVGVVFIGKALAMQRMIYGGHSPITLSRQTTIRPNKSDTGQFLGFSVIRRGVATSASWRHLTASWYRSQFDPFVEYATQGKGPFFFAWRPATFPQEVAYVWTSDDIAPSNMGKKDLMEVSLSMTGLA